MIFSNLWWVRWYACVFSTRNLLSIFLSPPTAREDSIERELARSR